MGVVAFALLATLALVAEAQESNTLREERRTLYNENQTQREDLRNEQRDERDAMRMGSTTPGDARTLYKEQMEERRALFQENSGERQAFRNEAQARVTQNMSRFLARTVELMNRMTVWLGEVSVKIEGRIAKIEAQGADVSTAQILLGEANSALGAAKESITTLEMTLNDAVASEDPTSKQEEIRTLMKNARDALVAARVAYGDVVAELRKLVDGKRTQQSGNSAPTIEQSVE